MVVFWKVLLGGLLRQVKLRIWKLDTDEAFLQQARDNLLLSEARCFNYLEYDTKAKSYKVQTVCNSQGRSTSDDLRTLGVHPIHGLCIAFTLLENTQRKWPERFFRSC